jgi:flagellar motor switch protein FliG
MKDKKLSAYFSTLGKKSAKARMKKLTPKERSRIASQAAKARWSQRDKGAAC